MSEQDQDQDQEELIPTMHKLMAQMAQMQAELNSLKERANTIIPPQRQSELPVKPVVSTTRRKALRKLAGGLLAGATMVGVAASLPEQAEAKLIAKPGRIGAIVTPNGDSTSNDLIGTGFNYGLLALSGTGNLNLYNDGTPGPANRAIVGISSGTSSTGVTGMSSGDFSSGVYGSGHYGVLGIGDSYGVYGQSQGTGTSTGYGVRGEGGYTGVYATFFPNGNLDKPRAFLATEFLAGDFFGDVNVRGNIQINGKVVKPGGSFKIDHPLDPANKYLSHSFVESPDMMNIYNGLVSLNDKGEATVEMPSWFEALNSDFRYQLTSIGKSMPDLYIAEKLTDRRFKIAGGKSGQEVSWQVTGIRQDVWAKANRIPLEEDKSESEKGKYLHPELFGQPKEMSVHPQRPTVG